MRNSRSNRAGVRTSGVFGIFVLFVLISSTGCWAPLRTHAIPARTLPAEFRTPFRSLAPRLNYSQLTAPPPTDYLLGPNDVLEVTIPELYEGAVLEPMRVRVMSTGIIQLPLAAPIKVGGMNLLQAQQAITRVYDEILKTPRVSVTLAEKAMIDVVVLGEVNDPAVVSLPKYQNDVGHALAAAGGLTREAAEMVEVHRRPQVTGEFVPAVIDHEFLPGCQEFGIEGEQWVLQIPLRGMPLVDFGPQDVVLQPGDVVVVPSRSNEVFFVVGQLNQSNLVRFSLGDRERELGTGLVLPRDRDIDVVTAVAMAGYIDPIDSPTTVSVHRTMPDGTPMMIRVDLIRARYDRNETVMVQAGDIIYVNPDAAWWFRRTLDRVVTGLILIPYEKIFR